MGAIVVLAVGMLVATAPSAARAAVDCEAARCAVQDSIDGACPCGDAVTHGPYVSCVVNEAERLAGETLLPRECKGRVRRCAARSVCGKREESVVCDLPVRCPAGTCTRCKLAPSAERCLARRGTVAARTSCCAECRPANPTPCGPTLICDAATEICVARQPFGPAVVYECRAVPAGCEFDRTCGCAGASLCEPPFDACSDAGANAIDCACPPCQ